MDSKKSRTSKIGREGISTSMWSASEKCYHSTGNFTYQWTQARLHFDLNEYLIFIFDSAPAHNNPAIPGPNSELKKLPLYSPFLNIVEHGISALKAAIKADISRSEQQEQMNNREEATRQGTALGNFRTQLLLHALQRNIGTITAAKGGQ